MSVDQFVDLHAHSVHSYLDGVGQPADIAKRLSELGRKAHAITDHANVSVHPAWERAAREEGVKPIFGVEAYFTPSVQADRENKTRRNHHLTILAENQQGYSNLLELVSSAYREGFYYKAMIDESMLVKHREGLIVLSGCLSSLLSQTILSADKESDDPLWDAREMALYFQGIVGAGNFFLETQLYGPHETLLVNQAQKLISLDTKIPLVVTNDVHTVTPAQADTRRMLHLIRDRNKWKDEDTFGYGNEHLLTSDEIIERAEWAGMSIELDKMCAQTAEIADRCNVELQKSEFISFPGVAEPDDALLDLIGKGWESRDIPEAKKEIYRNRVVREYNLIKEKGFSDYFLVVADLVHWAKKRKILVGPARGSAAGSLVCWLVGITEVDPIKFGLMFERFIDITRNDLPDIDIDFDQSRREEVKDYLRIRYGEDHVGTLGTFTGWRGKNTLEAAGKVYEIPFGIINNAKSYVDPRDDMSLEDYFEISPEMRTIATRFPDIKKAIDLEGLVKGFSTHACGVLVSSRPLHEVCATYYTRGEGDGVCSVDGPEAEALGLLKIDILGLKTLTVINEIARANDFDPYDLSFDDPEVWNAFQQGDVQGVFQFEGKANRQILAAYPKAASILDLAHITSLARPGPLIAGMDVAFCHRRAGIEDVTYRDPALAPILDWTNGLMIYQEQLMQVARQVAGMDWSDVNKLRKSISKKNAADFARLHDAFVMGCRTHSGMSEENAEAIWDEMAEFGKYGFNLSHAVSYCILSYWSMWCKVNYPEEFYSALLRHEEGDGKIQDYLLEFTSRGGTVLQPYYNGRGTWHAVGPMVIRAGLSSIKGVGDKVATGIEQYGPWESPEALRAGRNDKGRLIANVRQMEALEVAGAFDEDAQLDYMDLGWFRLALQGAEWTHKCSMITKDLEDEVVIAGMVSNLSKRSAKTNAERKEREAAKAEDREPNLDDVAIRAPEKDEYVAFELQDDTGKAFCLINRYKWAEKAMRDLFTDIQEGDVVTLIGKTNTGWSNVWVDQINQVQKKGHRY